MHDQAIPGAPPGTPATSPQSANIESALVHLFHAARERHGALNSSWLKASHRVWVERPWHQSKSSSFGDAMINFQIFGLCHHLRARRDIEHDFEQRVAWSNAELRHGGQEALIKSGTPYQVTDNDRAQMHGILQFATHLADQLELKPVHDRVDIFSHRVGGQISIHEFLSEVRVLREAFEQNIQFRHFYRYPQAKAIMVITAESEWKNITDAFPDAKDDAIAAIDCLALGYPTASGFHSMRVAEQGLRALAKERKIRLPKQKGVEWATWQEIIRAFDSEIKVIGGKKAGKAKDAALEFYSGARADLNGFKDEYRNLVMHVRAKYDELQALRASKRVQGFMQRLSAEIDHRYRRIKWGLR